MDEDEIVEKLRQEAITELRTRDYEKISPFRKIINSLQAIRYFIFENGLQHHLVRCPICGWITGDSFEICRTCGWEYDKYDSYPPDEISGANSMSLNEY
jgi:rubredoxin